MTTYGTRVTYCTPGTILRKVLGTSPMAGGAVSMECLVECVCGWVGVSDGVWRRTAEQKMADSA